MKQPTNTPWETTLTIILATLTIAIPIAHYTILALHDHYNAIQNTIYTLSLLLLLTNLIGITLGKLKLPGKHIAIPITLMALFATLSYFFSIDVTTSLWGTKGRYEGLLMLMSYYTIFISATLIRTDTLKLKLTQTFLFIGILHSLYGLCQHFNLFEPIIIDRYGYSISGVTGNPNFMGTYTVLLSGLASTFFYYAKKTSTRIFYYLCLLLFLFTMILTNTMSALFGTAAMILVFFIYLVITHKNYANRIHQPLSAFKLLIATIAIGSCGLLLLATLTDNPYLQQIQAMFADLNQLLTNKEITIETGARRFLVWKEASTLIPQYWLFGSGPDTFGIAYHNVFPVREEFFNKAHNEYLQVALTQGLPALASYLLLYGTILIFSIKKLVRIIRSKSYEFDFLYSGLFIAVIGYLFQAFFNISTIDVAPFFWLLLGLLASYTTPDKTPNTTLDMTLEKAVKRKNKEELTYQHQAGGEPHV